jgi:hypothetical protein
MAAPGSPRGTINDLVPEVINALQGRTDVAPIAPLYIKRAIQELSESYPFPELERTGPTVQLTTGLATYPASMFTNPNDDYTFANSWAIYVDFPTNQVVGPIDYRTPKAIEQMIAPATQGIPSKWTRYGLNFMFGPVPNQPYSVFLRYQVRHPFPDGNDAETLSGAAVYLPSSWDEIVAYSAAQRIAIVKRWNDQTRELHDILFGDPEYQMSEGKRGQPGLVSARVSQIQRDEMFNTRQMMITTPRYNSW